MQRLFIISFLLFSCLYGFGQLDTLCVPTIDTLDGQKVYSTAEKPAEFNGGQTSLFKFLTENLHYPNIEATFQGSIYSSFVVDTSGNIRNECIAKKYSGNQISYIEKEVIEVIKKMPKWIPAEQSGKKVYMRIILPIKFQLKPE